MKSWYLFFLLFFFIHSANGQSDSISRDISAIVFLDSFVVTATKKGFDVNDFIDIVQKDNSFFQAFHNIRFQDYTSGNKIEVLDKKKGVKAAHYIKVQQKTSGNCRTMDILEEKVSGNYFKNKKKRKHRYYTGRMHDQVFMTYGEVCADPSGTAVSEAQLRGIQKHINELKKLIFQPGREIDVPFIGGQTAIFKKNMLRYYNFYILSGNYKDLGDCYIFRVTAKPGIPIGKTIIKYMETYFSKTNFQVLARNYHLYYYSLIDFDVKMKVELSKKADKYLPTMVSYRGSWKIPARKRERVEFELDFQY